MLAREQDKNLLPKDTLASLSKKISETTKKKTTLSLSEKTIATIGGVIVRSKDGAIEADNTFESRTGRLRSELRFKVAEILFGGAS